MTLARIIASLSEEASRLAEHLNDLGFDVELVSPDEVPSAPADVEMRVEAFSVPAAFERAAQHAGSDHAVYVSPELLNPVEEAVPAAQPVLEPRIEEAPVQPAVEIEPAFEYEEIFEEEEELEPEFQATISSPESQDPVEHRPQPIGQSLPVEAREPVAPAAPINEQVRSEPRPNRVAEGVVTLGESVLAAGDAIGRGLSRAGSDMRWLGRRIGTTAVAGTESVRSAWRSHGEAREARRVEKERARQELARRQEELRVELERKREEIQAKRVEEERLRLARQEQRRLEQEKEQAARAAQVADMRRQAEERAQSERAAREAMLQQIAAERSAREAEAQPPPPEATIVVPSIPAPPPQPPVPATVSRIAASAHEIAGGMPRGRHPVRAHVRPAAPLSRRDQDWRRAFSLAAGLSLGLVVGWIALAGRRPANPIPLQNLVQSPSVQQPVPFGPTTITPSAQKPSPSIPAAAKPAPKPQLKPALRRARKVSSADDEQFPDDVVVRHFGAKAGDAKAQDGKAPGPVTQANTAKEQNGVKVFSDDQ